MRYRRDIMVQENNSAGVKQKKPKLAGLLHFREFGIGVIVVLVFVVASIIQPRFLTYGNIESILLYIPLVMVVSMGEMMVIVSRNFDLSVGSILGCSGIMVGLIFIKDPGFPIFPAFIIAVLIGAVLGAINGLLVTRLKLPAIIATLGTLNIYRGILYIASGGRQVDPNDIPENLIRLSQTSPIKVPWIVIFPIILAVIAYIFLRYSHIGREIYAVGTNPVAAKLRGINVNMVVQLVFTISGSCAGLAGIMYASRFGMLNPNQTGVGFEFIVIAATIIGGTSVNGGFGSVLGSVLGCMLLGVVNTALAVLGVPAFWQQATYGIIIIAALIIDKVVQDQLKFAIVRGESA